MPVPSVPAGLSAVGTTSNTGSVAALSWSAASGAITYSIYRSTVNGGPYVKVVDSLPGLTYNDINLNNNTPYYYAVSATNASGESALSTQYAFTSPRAFNAGFQTGAYRQVVTCNDLLPKAILGIPEGVGNITVIAKGSLANCMIVEECFDSGATVAQDTTTFGGGDTATWSTLDATLASVGTAVVKFDTPAIHSQTFLRARQLIAATTGTLVIVGKYITPR